WRKLSANASQSRDVKPLRLTAGDFVSNERFRRHAREPDRLRGVGYEASQLLGVHALGAKLQACFADLLAFTNPETIGIRLVLREPDRTVGWQREFRRTSSGEDFLRSQQVDHFSLLNRTKQQPQVCVVVSGCC